MILSISVENGILERLVAKGQYDSGVNSGEITE